MVPRVSASAPLDHDLYLSDTTFSLGESRLPQRTALSFEVIPPRNDREGDKARTHHLLQTLAGYNPDYVAVTSSQRSGWLEGTTQFIHQISTTTPMRPLAHLACTAGSRAELLAWIDRLMDAGVRGLLALRGDLPAGGMPPHHLQHADELVRLIRAVERHQAPRFAAGRLAVGVACYPQGHAESRSPDEDIDVLLAKQRSGADLAITQLFFDAEDYLRFAQRARLAGVRIPLIPGIMPMTSIKRVHRMAQLSGLPVPQAVIGKLSQARNDAEQHAIGMELTAALARTVLAGGAGCLHLYTHNNAETTQELLDRIGLNP